MRLITSGEIRPFDRPTGQNQARQSAWRHDPLPVSCRRLQFANRTMDVSKQGEDSRRRHAESESGAKQHRHGSPDTLRGNRGFDREPNDQHGQHHDGVWKSTGYNEVNEWRWPNESPLL